MLAYSARIRLTRAERESPALSACLCAAERCGSFFGLEHVDRPACFKRDGRAVLKLDEAHCRIFYFEGLGIPRSEKVALRSVLKRTEFVENAAGNGLNIVVVHAPQCDIESMCSDVDQGTAALCSLIHEYAPCRYTAAADRMSLAVINVAELALFASCVQVLHLASEAVLITYCDYLTLWQLIREAMDCFACLELMRVLNQR